MLSYRLIAQEEQLYESLAEIAVVIAYSHEAGLDDVDHNHIVLCSTFYPYSMKKGEMLHEK